MTPPNSSPVERVLDVALYAPVGLALAARDVVPRWADAGRRQLGAQFGTARMLGQLAIRQGRRQAGDALRRAASQAEGLLAGLGLAPSAPPAPGGRTASGANGAQAATPGAAASDTGPGPEARPRWAPTERGPRVVAAPPGGPASARLDAGALPIPGYDTLSASQIVQRLPGLSPDELDAVRAYEQSSRARKTVLLKVAQLRSGA
ncbi:MAG: hypothetical protein ABR511_08245 [Acidimicrobiales bacterium]